MTILQSDVMFSISLGLRHVRQLTCNQSAACCWYNVFIERLQTLFINLTFYVY